MRTGLRTLITLAVVAVVVVVAAGWGWSMLTHPFPKKADAPVCSNVTVHAGDHLFPAEVTVTVLNASRREGLAGRTMTALKDGGFAAGSSANAPRGTKVGSVQIWAADPQSPAVRLVAAWLPGAKVVHRTAAGPGVVVVVGDHFSAVGAGPKSVSVTHDAAVCSPTLS